MTINALVVVLANLIGVVATVNNEWQFASLIAVLVWLSAIILIFVLVWARLTKKGAIRG